MKLYGHNSVIERLRSNPQSVRHIYIEEGHMDSGYIHKKAHQHGIPVYVVPGTKILKIARNTNSQGIVTDVDDYAYVPYDELLEMVIEKRKTPVFLDALTDPQNLGAIIRSLACLGGFAVVLPTHDSVSVTETVLRVASGGDNHIPVAKVSNINQAIRRAKQEGLVIVGAVADKG